MPATFISLAEQDGLALRAYRGDSSVLLAFDLPKGQTKDLAGFAIECVTPSGKSFWLSNRISFDSRVHKATPAKSRIWTPSNEAPFQKFRWVDFVRDDTPGPYKYRVSAMYFAQDGPVEPGTTAEVTVNIGAIVQGALKMGFTRGYLSSQAYAFQFHNAPIRPPGTGLAFDTDPFLPQYEWLGYHARQMIFDFLDKCLNDESITVDVFAYDLDEPDIVRKLAELKKRLRIILDNASLHTKKGARERDTKKLLLAAMGEENLHLGHFRRFAHDKVIIQKKDGAAIRVLAGSANFSVRGLYVQANNVFVFEDPHAAALYQQAFEEAWNNMAHFPSSKIAGQWFPIGVGTVPKALVSFAPHRSASVSLDKVAEEINGADRAVLYAVMELGGSGPVMTALSKLPDRSDVFSYGVTQAGKHLTVFRPGDSHGLLVPFSFLKDKVPPPFQKEWSGGAGQVIHHKFVVVDFNDSDPVLFTGSSNLSKGGEEQNGDNLIAIYDRNVATAYAVEAIRLVDHYQFRAAMKGATKANPLRLRGADASTPWWKPYYDPENVKFNDRKLFVNPAG